MSHLEDEALREDALDAASRAHVADCGECRVRRRRLRAGLLLLREAQETPPPAVVWDTLDVHMRKASESAARDVRRSQQRAARPWGRVGMGLMAAAAVTVLALGAGMNRSHPRTAVSQLGTLAQRVNAAVSHGPSGNAQPEVAPAPERLMASVLLVAGDVQVSTAEGPSSSLEVAQRVGRGSRVRAGRAGRAVLALPGGARLDVRPGSTVTIEELATEGNRVTLGEGETRLDVADVRTTLEVERSAWSVSARGAALVAKVESEHVQLRVVLGKVDVQRDHDPRREGVAGQHWELDRDGASARVVDNSARDAGELALEGLDSGAAPSVLPAVPTGASVLLNSHALPVGVRGLRLAREGNVQVRTASGLLVLGRGDDGQERWVGAGSPALVAARSVRSGAVAAVAPVAVESAPLAPAPVVAVQPIPPPEHATLDAQLSAEAANQELARRLSARLGVCARACAAGACDNGVRGYLALDTEADGSIASVRAESLPASVRSCVTDAARALVVPSSLRVRTVQVHVQSPRP